MLAITHYFDLRFGYTRNIEDAQRSLTKYAALALSLNAQEPYAVAVQATHLSFSGRFQEAVQAARLATEISPNDAFCWLVLARMCLGAELLDEGERAVRRAMRLNPFYPVNYLAVLADALVHQGRDTEALEVLASLVKRNPNYISAHLHLAGLHGQAGNWDAARAAVAEVQRINPAYRLEMARRFYLSADEERQERFVAALRTAGIPE